jgi:Putative lumazine-binding
MNKTILLITMVMLSAGIQAQSTEDSVKATVNRLFAAMKESDGKKLASTFSDSAVLQTISRNKKGETVVLNEGVGEFAESVGKLPVGDADERIVFETVKVDGPLAMVWAPYQFWYKGKFSHCGVDVFQLVRMQGEWKIVYLIDTRRTSPCL